jgi:hypothetical protein
MPSDEISLHGSDELIKITCNKNVDIKFIAHGTFLE